MILYKLRNFFEQGVVFDFAGGTEAGMDLVEVRVVIAGMADEFPSTRWHGVKHFLQGGGVQPAGSGDADGAISGVDGCIHYLRLVAEIFLERME